MSFNFINKDLGKSLGDNFINKKVKIIIKRKQDVSNSNASNSNSSNGELKYYDTPYSPTGYKLDKGMTQRSGKTDYSSNYKSGVHNGIDLDVTSGSQKAFNIIAPQDLKVKKIGTKNTGFGYYVLAEDAKGQQYMFGHLPKDKNVKVGQVFKAGDVISKSGNSGNSTANHLHLSIFPKGENPFTSGGNYIKPEVYFKNAKTLY